MTKKAALLLALLLTFLFFGACGSTAPTPAQEATPPTQPTRTTEPPRNVETTGNRHQSGIILDGAERYTVKRRDTLSKIARQKYRDGSLYPLIMMVSSSVRDPDKIFPGMNLTIPALNVNLNDSRAREAMNSYFADIAKIEDRRGRRKTAALIRRHIQ